MNYSIKVKSFIANILQYIGATKYIIGKCLSDKYIILMYHRIIPNKEVGPSLQSGMYVEPRTFETHVKYLKKYFQIVPLSEISKNYGKSFSSKRKPNCILTFDDGWLDFYKYAYPILKAHDVPATVFLPTKFIGTKNQFWTDALAQLCYGRQEEEGGRRKNPASPNPEIDLLENGNGSMETRLENFMEWMKSMPEEEIQGILGNLRERWEVGPVLQSRDFLTWDEVREMHRSGLVSFGSHTETHRILTTLRDDEIVQELRRSKERLAEEGVADSSFSPFAYPNGNHTDKIMQFVKEHGYSLAVTTRKGWVRYADRGNSFALNRIGIHQDMASTVALFGCRIIQLI